MPDEKVYGLTAHDFKRMVQTVLRSERSPRGFGSESDASGSGNVQWFPFRNDYSGTIPGRSIMRITGATTFSSLNGGGVDDQPILTCDQPNTTFYRQYAVCEANDVATGEYGLCALSGLLEVAYDTGTPAQDEGWGPKPSQFTLSKQYPSAASILAVTDSTNKYALCNFGPINTVIGELSGTLSRLSSATVKIHQSSTPGSEAVINASLTISGRDCLMKSGATAIASGKKVVCQWINGIWYVTEGECA